MAGIQSSHNCLKCLNVFYHFSCGECNINNDLFYLLKYCCLLRPTHSTPLSKNLQQAHNFKYLRLVKIKIFIFYFYVFNRWSGLALMYVSLLILISWPHIWKPIWGKLRTRPTPTNFVEIAPFRV